MRILRNLKCLFLLGFIVLFEINLIETQAQVVERLKGPIIKPANLEKGVKVSAGQIISTGSTGRVILSYSLGIYGGRPCYGFVIINRNESYKVPEKLVYGTPKPRGSKETLQAISGIGIVILYGPPGANGGGGITTPLINADVTGREKKEFDEEMDKVLNTLSGTVSSIENDVIKLQGGVLLQTAPDTKFIGVTGTNELKNKEVWVEYLDKMVYDQTIKSNKFFREAVLVMLIQSPEFYQYLEFEEKEPFREDTKKSSLNQSYIKFDDGYIMAIDEKPTKSDGIYSVGQLKIQRIVGKRFDYEHILNTSFIKKISKSITKDQ